MSTQQVAHVVLEFLRAGDKNKGARVSRRDRRQVILDVTSQPPRAPARYQVDLNPKVPPTVHLVGKSDLVFSAHPQEQHHGQVVPMGQRIEHRRP